MTGQQGAPAPNKRHRRAIIAAGSTAAVLGIAGCGPSISMLSAPWSESEAVIESALFGEKNVTFDEPPVISVENGRIESVTVSGPKGQDVGGKLVEDGSKWQLDTSDLEFGTKYAVSATAVDLRGKETSTSDSFRTFVPEKELVASTEITNGETYGVGMPIIVTFNLPVKNKADIEQRLGVAVDGQPVEGAWNWESDTSVTYRPKEYWPANTKVTLDADIKGVNAGNQVYALKNTNQQFKIGDSLIITQDSAKHQITVKRNGKVVKTMPSSSGKPGYETRSGNKLIMSKEPYVVMDAASLGVSPGDPDYYRLDVYNAMRITWSGEYIHSAPWSVGSQGYANVSHGCVNVSPDNAVWLMDNAHIGDPVIVKNSGVGQDLGNGWTMWEESWEEWQDGSALEG